MNLTMPNNSGHDYIHNINIDINPGEPNIQNSSLVTSSFNHRDKPLKMGTGPVTFNNKGNYNSEKHRSLIECSSFSKIEDHKYLRDKNSNLGHNNGGREIPSLKVNHTHHTYSSSPEIKSFHTPASTNGGQNVVGNDDRKPKEKSGYFNQRNLVTSLDSCSPRDGAIDSNGNIMLKDNTSGGSKNKIYKKEEMERWVNAPAGLGKGSGKGSHSNSNKLINSPQSDANR
jgi:hypothetical protein